MGDNLTAIYHLYYTANVVIKIVSLQSECLHCDFGHYLLLNIIYGDRHYRTCDGCDKKNYAEHDFSDGNCICGKKKQTEGLDYTLNGDGES